MPVHITSHSIVIFVEVSASVVDNLDGTYSVTYETLNVNLAGGFVRAYLHAPGGLMANYFGDYFFDTVGPAGYERIDPTIDFDWGYDAPYIGFPLSNFFSIEWSGFITTEYRFFFIFSFHGFFKSQSYLYR